MKKLSEVTHTVQVTETTIYMIEALSDWTPEDVLELLQTGDAYIDNDWVWEDDSPPVAIARVLEWNTGDETETDVWESMELSEADRKRIYESHFGEEE